MLRPASTLKQVFFCFLRNYGKGYLPTIGPKAAYCFVLRVSGNKESSTTESLKGSAPGATAPGMASPSGFLLRFQGAVVRLAISTTIKSMVSRKTINTMMKIFLFLFNSAMGWMLIQTLIFNIIYTYPSPRSFKAWGVRYSFKVPVLAETSAQLRSSNSTVAMLHFSIDTMLACVRYSVK